ncbi:hypothetical protein RclHR1_01310010 [Rhizophagus clarus]|uniref:Zinc finger BED domain-containing protein 1-like n=1 Tax=Rhizophagus clarus TaxID=94130 RepID=A0A2Z6QPB0_9GLOM|nr:hypothetical protein RclHR1_01310010 [Rhizophagus clarus]GES91747.1 zinc finger BED domain-containing protein 1-like [Rhizophagus clarus]
MATTTRNKHRQLAKEAERQILVQEEESDTDSDYKATNSSKSEEEASDQTISDNDVINISNDNDDDDADISINENVSKKRKPPSKIIKPKTSWVWKFFRETEDGSKVICLIEGCEKMLKWYGSPSSMKTHLSGTHHITKGIAANYLEALQKGDQNLISNIIEEEKSKSHPYSKQESLTKNVIGFVIGTVQPLSIVEDKDFIKMVNGFDLFYKVPCTKTLKEQISLAYEAGTEKVKNQLLQLENISLTLDTWSSSAHIPYLGVTAHWVTSKFEPYELLLSMEELPYPHGAIEIQEHLIDLFDDWGISSKINGSNVKKACSNMNIGERIPCIVHTLQLSVGKGLDIAKVESQIYLFQQQKLQKNNEELEKEAENLVVLDVVKANNTRWNSTLYAFQRLIILKPAILMLKTSLINDRSSRICRKGEKMEELYPTSHEWKIIKEMVELLCPFESVTCLLSGATYPLIGLTYPSLCNLKEILETEFILSFETNIAENCRKAILEDLQSRWEFPQELCLKGSFLDPRFKSLDFVSQEMREKIINQLQTEYKVLKNDLIPSIPVRSNENQSNLTTMGSFWKKKNKRNVTPIKNEVQHYLNLPELPALEEYDSFTWWTTNKAQYPILYKMAMKNLSIPATSVPSERLFSDANNLVTPQRTRLDSSIINKIMFLKRNREHVDIFTVKK